MYECVYMRPNCERTLFIFIRMQRGYIYNSSLMRMIDNGRLLLQEYQINVDLLTQNKISVLFIL